MRRALLLSLLLFACADPPAAPAKPAVAKRGPAPAKPAPAKPAAGPKLILSEALSEADALVFVLTSTMTELERGKGRYSERMTITATPDEVVFAQPPIDPAQPLVIEVPYREIMEAMGGTPDTRKTGLTRPNAHPTLPMGWILDREGERWIARAAVRGLVTDRAGLKQLAEASRGDPSPEATLARMVQLETSGASGLGRALAELLVRRLAGADAAKLAALVQPHVDGAIAALDPAAWPGVQVFLLRHASEADRRRAVKQLLARYDAAEDKALVEGSTRAVLADLLDPSADSPLYPLDARDFKRFPKMDPELLKAARAFAGSGP